jgi:16S rRNA (guanine(966)-N(2))-methyltransferase RsmD
MRIITGLARGRRLIEPEGMNIRPTTDQVKESIFNIIQFDIEGRSFLDLFAGSGQMGLEALSRGAKSATFVDESKTAIKLVRDNIALSKLEGARVQQGDSISFLMGKEKFDIIFLDPPYDSPLLEKALQKIVEFDKLNSGGIIVCECQNEKVLPELSEPYCFLKSYRYGKIKISVFTKH